MNIDNGESGRTNTLHASPEAYVPEWAKDSVRDKLYESLYKGGGSVQLEPALWRAVFDVERPSVGYAFTDNIGRPMPLMALDWAREQVGFRFTRSSRVRVDSLKWSPPRANSAAGRAFEVQTDGYLCAMHALNNVAGSVVADPALMMSTIGAMRRDLDPHNSYSMYAQRGELIVAALRRGIVLAPLSIASFDDYDSLRGDKSGVTRCVERLLRESGGMIVLMPGSAGSGGHFVSLVPARDSTGDWVVYSMNGIIVRKSTVGDTLRSLVRRFVGADLIGANRSSVSAQQLAVVELVALVPLNVEPSIDAVQAGNASSHATLARLWARNVLANSTLSPQSMFEDNGTFDVHYTTPPPTAVTLHFVCNHIMSDRVRAVAAINAQNPAYNPFTLNAALYSVSLQLNVAASDLASLIAAPVDDRSRDDIQTSLRVMRSILRSPDACGLMLSSNWRSAMADSSATNDGDVQIVCSRASQCSAISNGIWLRFSAVLIATRALDTALSSDAATSSSNWSDIDKLLSLLVIVAFTDLRDAGDTARRYTSLEEFWNRVQNDRAGTLPSPLSDQESSNSDSALPHEDRIVANVFNARPVDAQIFALENDVPIALWMLSSLDQLLPAQFIVIDRFTLAALEPCGYDRAAAEQDIPMLDYVRTRIFLAPSHATAVQWRIQAEREDGNGSSGRAVASSRSMRRQVATYFDQLISVMDRDITLDLSVGRVAFDSMLDSLIAQKLAGLADDVSAEQLAVATEFVGAAVDRAKRALEHACLERKAELFEHIHRLENSLAAIEVVDGDSDDRIRDWTTENMNETLLPVKRALDTHYDAALQLVNTMAFSQLYDTFVPAVIRGQSDADAALDAIAVQVDADDALSPQILEHLFVQLGADTLAGSVYDIVPLAGAYDYHREGTEAPRNVRISGGRGELLPRVEPTRLLSSLAPELNERDIGLFGGSGLAEDAADDNDGFQLVGARRKKKHK